MAGNPAAFLLKLKIKMMSKGSRENLLQASVAGRGPERQRRERKMEGQAEGYFTRPSSDGEARGAAFGPGCAFT